MTTQLERHTINDSLYIFLQDNSTRWYARFQLYGKWLCKSTKEKEKDLAIAKAQLLRMEWKIKAETGTLTQSKRFRDVALVTKITDLEKVEGIGNQIPAWEIWDQLSDLCDGINTDGRARYKNIAKSNFQLGHNFLLSWLVQLLTSQVKVLKDS